MIIREFSDWELKKMSEEGRKPKGWHRYKDSPYAQHKEYMESMGYEKEVEHENTRREQSDTR